MDLSRIYLAVHNNETIAMQVYKAGTRSYYYIVVYKYVHNLDAVGSSRILIGKQKIGLTFNSDKLGGNDFTKFSKLTMCSA